MSKSLEQYETLDMLSLKLLSGHDEFKGSFGISRIQRLLRIGYNRAALLAERALNEGLLERCDSPSHHLTFSTAKQCDIDLEALAIMLGRESFESDIETAMHFRKNRTFSEREEQDAVYANTSIKITLAPCGNVENVYWEKVTSEADGRLGLEDMEEAVC